VRRSATIGVKESRIIPAMHHGVKVISVGFFVDKDEAVVARPDGASPAAAIPRRRRLGRSRLSRHRDPAAAPATLALSLSQLVPIAGSVMVTTPRRVSIVDVVKGIAMFEKVEIPIPRDHRGT
jgi:ATP-binding protein involved in chromosome partitioning